jgi:DNA mismatch repair protein MutS2
MKNFLENAGNESLVLIDEFGSGTEPESGAAIAEAVLNGLNKKSVFGIITTHYFNLKMFASNNEGLVNAAMLFDNALLRPQYILKSGKPGSSFALEIASSIGLPQDILNAAGENIGQGRIEMEKMVQDLENEKIKLEDRRKELSLAEDFVNELIQKYENLNKSLLDKRDRILRKAELEAETKLDKANALIEKTIREIKESGAEQQKSKKIRKDFDKEKLDISGENNNALEQLPLKKSNKIDEKPIIPSKIGDIVRLENGHDEGEIIEIKGKKAKVLFSHAQLEIALEKLIKIDPKNEKKSSPRAKMIIEEKALSTTLDLRGKRADEALVELDKYIDQALLLGMHSFSILHGKGQGILRKIIRDQLSDYRELLRFEDAPSDSGGEGITEVKVL